MEPSAQHTTGTTPPVLLKDGSLRLSGKQLHDWIGDLAKTAWAEAKLDMPINAEILPEGCIVEGQANRFVLHSYKHLQDKSLLVLQSESGKVCSISLSELENGLCKVMLSERVGKGSSVPWDEIYESIQEYDPPSGQESDKGKRKIQNAARRVNEKCSGATESDIRLFALGQ